MFAVMSSIKKTLPLSDRTLEILLIQEGHEGYAGEMSHIPNCNIYSYHNNLDKRLKANLPTNMFIINDLDSIITNSFDYIVCIGRTNSAAIANELKRRFSCPMILVDDAADSTYCIRPFGIPLNNRINVDFIANSNSKDPASVAYDGVASGLANNKKHIFIDSAGRLHSSDSLMRELEKIYKVIVKQTDQVDVLITIDSTLGQNSLNQIKEFSRYVPVNGVILT